MTPYDDYDHETGLLLPRKPDYARIAAMLLSRDRGGEWMDTSVVQQREYIESVSGYKHTKAYRYLISDERPTYHLGAENH